MAVSPFVIWSKWIMEESSSSLEELVQQFKFMVQKNKWMLSEPSVTRGLCGTVSEAFATFLIEHGHSPQAAKVEWSGFVAVPVHYAVEVSGRIYDWTASQFLGDSVNVPAVFSSLEEWKDVLARTVKSHKEPVASVSPIVC